MLDSHNVSICMAASNRQVAAGGATSSGSADSYADAITLAMLLGAVSAKSESARSWFVFSAPCWRATSDTLMSG